MKRKIIDQILGKIISRKLLVWLVSTILVCFGFISSSDWVYIASVYIGVEGISDAITRFKELKAPETKTKVSRLEQENTREDQIK